MATREFSEHQRRQASRAHISWVDRVEYAVRSRGAKVVVLSLVANTMVAQLLYNSAGQLVLGNGFLTGYLFVSAICSTVAFVLFEVSTIFQLHDLHTLDASIKEEIGAEQLIRRGYVVLAVSSLINFLSMVYFLALVWHSAGGSSATFPLDTLRRPTRSYSSSPASMASGLRAPRRSCWRRSAPWSSRRWRDGSCRKKPRSRA
jgi:hypothetical protein